MPVAGLGRSKNSSAATPLIDRTKTNADTMMMMMTIMMMTMMMMTMMMMTMMMMMIMFALLILMMM